MVQLLLILTFASMHVHDSVLTHHGHPRQGVGLLVMSSVAVAWLVVHAVASLAGRRMDRAGSLAAAWSAERVVLAARFAGTGVVIVSVLWWGWLDAVRRAVGDLVLVDELLAASPVLLLLLLTWWSMYPIDRRLKEAAILRHLDDGTPLHAPPTRGQYVLSQVRFQVMMILVPVSLLTAWSEVLARVPKWAGWRGLFPHVPAWWGWAEPALSWGGILLVLTLTPVILRHVWDTVPLERGPLWERAIAVCRRYRVRVRGPLVWRTHGSMLNGAILGLFWPFRYMLFTDALLERLGGEQVEGVIAHEVAHVRERHMIWLAVLMLGAVLCISWLAAVGAWAAGISIDSPEVALLIAGGTLAASGLLFGLVSRRFEWQADAFAVKHLSTRDDATIGGVTPGAASSMAGTLQAVADLNGIRTDRFTFRHGSIAERQRRIRALAGLPVGRLPIDRQVGAIKIIAVVLAVGGLGPAIAGLLMGGTP